MVSKARNDAWKFIYDKLVNNHKFNQGPKAIKHQEIKDLITENKNKKYFPTTTTREIRTLCTQTKETQRPEIFVENELFLLPKSNKSIYLIKGNGYFNFKKINLPEIKYFKSQNNINLITTRIGSSEANAIDNAFNSGLLQHLYNPDGKDFFLTSRGRHYGSLEFKFDDYGLKCKGIQFEPDAIYEGKNNILILEAKTGRIDNYIIRQLFFPYYQVNELNKKLPKPKAIKCVFLFAQKNRKEIFEYTFIDIEFKNPDKMQYNVLEPIKRYIIK